MFNLFTVLGDSNGDAGSGAGTIDINNGDGSFNGSITGIDAMAGTGFVASNTPLYLLVQANDQTEWGIFHDSGWVVPTDGIITIPEQVFTVDTSEVLRGVDNGATLGLALVPEPSIALLGLFGLGFFFRRQRRG
ncbi:MAG: PEP-CTERM sorting domain-containing protein [Verrucomicrobiota bacterium]